MEEKKEEAPRKPWHCKHCPPDNPTRLQQVFYGHVENGKFVVDEKTDFACVYCHTVYSDFR